MGGKFSLMGIYGPDIYIIGTAPTILPKFVLVLEIFSDIHDALREIALHGKMQNAQSNLFQLSLPPPPTIEKTEDMQRLTTRVFVPLSPFPLPQEGVLEVHATINGVSMRAGRINVHFVANAAALVPDPTPPLRP